MSFNVHAAGGHLGRRLGLQAEVTNLALFKYGLGDNTTTTNNNKSYTQQTLMLLSDRSSHSFTVFTFCIPKPL